LDDLMKRLHSSIPFFSPRYQAHMNWDTVLPGSLGYMAAILYNQNNVATEASPVTSKLEKEVGEQLCKCWALISKKAGAI
jgi:vitellogenic carboxypeptidase-like protein